MTDEAKILFPSQKVRLGEREIEVRELAWADALAFLADLGKHFGKFMDAEGNVRISAESVAGVIAGTQELAESLMVKATGLTQEQCAELPISGMLSVIDAALAVNLSDDLFATGKRIAGRFQKFAVPRTAPPATPPTEPSTTS
jgi:hypothetical protein